jgi:peptidoglycan/xylan/chitin deacetylase (PgdA/CDA1 family)
MRIVMIHGVGDGRLPAAVFERQMRYVQRTADVVPLETLVDGLARGEPPGRRVALTFDDGLRNHVTVAYPLLKRLGIPATFFVCPGLIETGQWLWNAEARERLRSLDPLDREPLSRQLGAPGWDIEEVVAWMKRLPTRRRFEVEDQIRQATPRFVSDVSQREANDPLSWEDLAAIDSSLVTIGSHSMTHPTVTSLDDDELSIEVRESRRVLEARLGRPVRFFCYPSGAYDERSLAAVRETYEAAVSSEEGFVTEGSDLHRLRRIPAGESVELMAWRLHRPRA